MIGWIKERQVRDGKRRQQKNSCTVQGQQVSTGSIGATKMDSSDQFSRWLSTSDVMLLGGLHSSSRELKAQGTDILLPCCVQSPHWIYRSHNLFYEISYSTTWHWGSLQASVATDVSWALCSWTSVSILLDHGSNSWTSISFLLDQGNCPRLSPDSHCQLNALIWKNLILVDCFSFQNPVL